MLEPSRVYGFSAQVKTYGRGALTNDYKAALVWYKKALEKKHPATMNHLATMCMTSQGVEADFEKAVKLYEEAAKLGNTDAMLNLGVLHEYGLVFKQDKKEAVKWYEKAAEKGNAAAMRVLGDINHRERSDHRDDRKHGHHSFGTAVHREGENVPLN